MITLFKTICYARNCISTAEFRITGQTAAEIIKDRVNASLPNMGLTNFRGVKPRKQDVAVAKNYLQEDELAALSNLVEQYLIFAEGQAMRRIPMNMQDWIAKLNGFLGLNDRDILDHAGKVSQRLAKEIAEKQYEQFHQKRIQDADQIEGDFERMVESLAIDDKNIKQ